MLSSNTLRLSATVCCMWAAITHAQTAKPYTNSLGIKMVGVQKGSFKMGAATTKFQLGKVTDYSKDAPYYDETPVHEVTITYPFYISETEVTIEQFQRFKKEYKDAGEFKPYAAGISWNEAMAFCKWLSKKEGKNYRLPTEAEWEYFSVSSAVYAYFLLASTCRAVRSNRRGLPSFPSFLSKEVISKGCSFK